MDNAVKSQKNNTGKKTKSFSSKAIGKIEYLIQKLFKTEQWATSSFEMWLMLLNLLFLIKPKNILEFGAGRSTNYFADYAYKNNIDFISLEHHKYYYLKVKLGMQLSYVDPEYLKFIPLKNGWYNIKKISKLLNDYDNFDFLFIDGPTNIYFKRRDPDIFYDFLLPKLQNVNVIIIDDTQVENGNAFANNISNILNLKRVDFKYFAGATENKLAILLRRDLERIIDLLPDYIKAMF
jgi:predicted O-methyltransferase YrrM